MKPNNRGGMRSYQSGKMQNFIIIGLVLLVMILGLNYYSLSHRNVELVRKFEDSSRDTRRKHEDVLKQMKQLLEEKDQAKQEKLKLEQEQEEKLKTKSDEINDLNNQIEQFKKEIEDTKNSNDIEKEKCTSTSKELEELKKSFEAKTCDSEIKNEKIKVLTAVQTIYGGESIKKLEETGLEIGSVISDLPPPPPSTPQTEKVVNNPSANDPPASDIKNTAQDPNAQKQPLNNEQVIPSINQSSDKSVAASQNSLPNTDLLNSSLKNNLNNIDSNVNLQNGNPIGNDQNGNSMAGLPQNNAINSLGTNQINMQGSNLGGNSNDINPTSSVSSQLNGIGSDQNNQNLPVNINSNANVNFNNNPIVPGGVNAVPIVGNQENNGDNVEQVDKNSVPVNNNNQDTISAAPDNANAEANLSQNLQFNGQNLASDTLLNKVNDQNSQHNQNPDAANLLNNRLNVDQSTGDALPKVDTQLNNQESQPLNVDQQNAAVDVNQDGQTLLESNGLKNPQLQSIEKRDIEKAFIRGNEDTNQESSNLNTNLQLGENPLPNSMEDNSRQVDNMRMEQPLRIDGTTSDTTNTNFDTGEIKVDNSNSFMNPVADNTENQENRDESNRQILTDNSDDNANKQLDPADQILNSFKPNELQLNNDDTNGKGASTDNKEKTNEEINQDKSYETNNSHADSNNDSQKQISQL